MLATVLQTPESFSWRLRNFRKRQNGENGPCGTSASIKMGKMALAELPQASKWGKWRLRNFRKRQNGENGVCGTSASIKMEKMALAGLPQTLTLFLRAWRGMVQRKRPDTGGFAPHRYPAEFVGGPYLFRRYVTVDILRADEGVEEQVAEAGNDHPVAADEAHLIGH